MAKKDYYDVLGVERGADEKAIKRAYKKLAMQYHPDRTKGDKAKEEKFKEIQEAYEILGDKRKTCGLRSIRSRSLRTRWHGRRWLRWRIQRR